VNLPAVLASADGRKRQAATSPWLPVLFEAHTEGYAMTDEEGKRYLISRGVLRPHAMKWKRTRQFGYTAECWKRHEQREAERLISDLWRGVYQIFVEVNEREAYQSMPLRDRTRYEKLLAELRPLTPEQWQFGMAFVKAWKDKAGRCE
jgi:hypothetical protein